MASSRLSCESNGELPNTQLALYISQRQFFSVLAYSVASSDMKPFSVNV
jgi:hypothetical protein